MKTAIIILAILWTIGFVWHWIMFRGIAEWTEMIDERLEAEQKEIELLHKIIDADCEVFESFNKRIKELEKGRQ